MNPNSRSLYEGYNPSDKLLTKSMKAIDSVKATALKPKQQVKFHRKPIESKVELHLSKSCLFINFWAN